MEHIESHKVFLCFSYVFHVPMCLWSLKKVLACFFDE